MTGRWLWLAATTALLCSSCNWTDFDDLGTDTPTTVFFDKAYGSRVALAAGAGGVTLLATGGEPGQGVRIYSAGDGLSEPTTATRSASLCELSSDKLVAGTPCLGGTTVASAGVIEDAGGIDHPGCFVVGYGRVTTDAKSYGVVLACADGQIFTALGASGTKIDDGLKVLDPGAVAKVRISFGALPGLGKTSANNPTVVMGSEADAAAWWWPALQAGGVPKNVPGPTDAKAGRFGATVAMAKAGGQPLVLVAAPDNGRVHAYVPGTDGELAPLACLSGDKGFGTTIAVGDLDKDGADDLAVTDGSAVRIFLGKNRPPAVGTGDCPAPWPAESIKLACADTPVAGGCEGSGFGASMAMGDLDGNGTIELAVGAPSATYAGVPNAGAVFLFSPMESAAVVDARGLTSPSAGDGFGASVAIGKVGVQDTLAVGARGKSQAFIAWCTKLPGTPSTPRCRK